MPAHWRHPLSLYHPVNGRGVACRNFYRGHSAGISASGSVRKIMTRAFAEQRERGQSVAGLWGRKRRSINGMGLHTAGALREYQVDTTDIRLLTDSEDLPATSKALRRMRQGRFIKRLLPSARAICIAVKACG